MRHNYLHTGGAAQITPPKSQRAIGAVWQRLTTCILALFAFTLITQAAERKMYLQSDGNTRYVNMPRSNRYTYTLTLDNADVTSFKVYDDGGKDDNYRQSCNGSLLITVPEGYRLKLSGTIAAGKADVLTVYDNYGASGTRLLNSVSSSPNEGDVTSLPSVYSSGRYMTINFKTDRANEFAGLDLTLTLVNANTANRVNLKSVTGGSISSDKATAKPGEKVSLTATAESGYVLQGVSVTDADGNTLIVEGGKWYTHPIASFVMPASDVSVTPTFANTLTAESGLHINMPATGSQAVIIPSNVSSFKVYDDGGKDNNYSSNCNGTLVMTAPAGYVLQLSGTIATKEGVDYINVYDNMQASGTLLLDSLSSSDSGVTKPLPKVVSSDRHMTLYFHSEVGYKSTGLDLTVQVIDPNVAYQVQVNSCIGGEVTCHPTSAKSGERVSLTAIPENGYVLEGISVADTGGSTVSMEATNWYTPTTTFIMPASNVSVTAAFTTAFSANGGQTLNIPKTGEQTATIPESVTSFKVYDDGGKNGGYSNMCNGTLVLTAPEGCTLQLSGSITAETSDCLTVYDNSEDSGAKLIDALSSKSNGVVTTIDAVKSSGRSLTLLFKADHSATDAGLNLTVTVLRPTYSISSAGDWTTFCRLVNGGQTNLDAKLTNNINLGTDMSMVGNYTNRYTGTFDGDGHSITVDWDVNTESSALFFCINGATLRNLYTQGSISTSRISGGMSGMVWSANGNTTLTDCSSMINLNAKSVDGWGAGIIGRLEDGASATLHNCIVGGAFQRLEVSDNDKWQGFIYSLGGSSTLHNCLYIGENYAQQNSNTFVSGGTSTLEHCYYLNACGIDEPQGEQISDEELKNGQVLRLLQGDSSDQCYWAQVLGEVPELYRETNKTKANYVYYDTANQQWTCDNLQVKDGEATPIALDLIASHVTYNRNFGNAQGATLCLPYDLPLNGTFQAYTLSGGSSSTLHFREVTGTLEAYHPYYIVPSASAQLGGKNIQVKAFNEDVIEASAGNYVFKGTTIGMDNDEAEAASAYILQHDNLWHKVTSENSDAYIPPYRAYILCNTSEAKALRFVLDDDTTTDLRAIQTTDADGSVRYYDLNGRYIGTTLDGQPSGLYISNGQKVVHP